MAALANLSGALLGRVRDTVSQTVAKASQPLAPYAPGSYGFQPPSSWPTGWWQMGFRTPRHNGSSAAEACVSAITQTVASLPCRHKKRLPNGGEVEVKGSYVNRVLRKPNSYQTRADFFLNLLRNEWQEGNGYAFALRDPSFRIDSLHIASSPATRPYVADDGSIFYGITMSDVMARALAAQGFFVDGMAFWPQRDVLHIRMQTPSHPLIGESPILAAALARQTGIAIQTHMDAFFNNMSRPSGYLKTTGTIKADVAEKLRSEWQMAFSQAGAGRVAVLQGGLDWQQLSMSAVDAAIIDSYRLTVQDIARVYRTPLAIIGESGGTNYGTTEALIRHWLSTGLGYVLEHTELALDALFDLPEDEFTEFDVDYLLRSDFLARIDGLTKGITGGLFSPNEARNREGLPSVQYGDEPRLQAQVVPLSFAVLNPSAAAAATNPSAPAAGRGLLTDDSRRARRSAIASFLSELDRA